MTPTEEVFAVFARRGAGAYFGESVSMTDHMLQAAHLARLESAGPYLVLAALLHDVGHLLEDAPHDPADWTADARHEEMGGRWLAQRFPAGVSEPVRLHVPAKRYLCATDPGYCAELSSASLVTLELQGGPMNAVEIARFVTERFWESAVRVRRWDDRGKIAGLKTPALAAYAALISRLTISDTNLSIDKNLSKSVG